VNGRALEVRVDTETCTGHGRCYVLAPDVYAPDEYGHCVVVHARVGDDLAAQARAGADNCPERAITVE
jgi:ferredoxin